MSIPYAPGYPPTGYLPVSYLPVAAPPQAWALPPAPMAAPVAGYQGLLDQLHLASQTPFPPPASPPYAPAMPAQPPYASPLPLPVTPMQPPYAPPAPQAPPTMAGLFQQLDQLVNRLSAPPAGPVPPPAPVGTVAPTPAPPPAPKPPEAKPEPKPKPKPPKPEPKPEPKPAPKPPKPPAPPKPKLPAMNRDNFVSQYRSSSNTREDAPSNGNCGPTSLTIIAEAFGKLKVTPDNANRVIEDTRRRMGAGTSQSSEYNGTSYEQLLRGAKSYGLNGRVVYGSIKEVQNELKQGRLVIAHVRPSYLFPGTTSGHYAVVTKIDGDKVHMHDPANPKGPMTVSVATFKKAQAGRGTYGLIAIGR